MEKMYLWIALGSALGGAARYGLSGFVAARFGETFPWGTFLVNATGSFLIGLIAALARPEGRLFLGPTLRQFLMLGLLGGFTTFSSFSIQTLSLARDGDWLRAGANVLASVAGCLAAVWLGDAAGSAMTR